MHFTLRYQKHEVSLNGVRDPKQSDEIVLLNNSSNDLDRLNFMCTKRKKIKRRMDAGQDSTRRENVN